MEPDLKTVEIIEKEHLPEFHFPTTDVLANAEARVVRQHDAERATTLGNAYHGKVDIYFQTADGATKRVHTSVWATHQEYITLKYGMTIPLHAILRFDFY